MYSDGTDQDLGRNQLSIWDVNAFRQFSGIQNGTGIISNL